MGMARCPLHNRKPTKCSRKNRWQCYSRDSKDNHSRVFHRGITMVVALPLTTMARCPLHNRKPTKCSRKNRWQCYSRDSKDNHSRVFHRGITMVVALQLTTMVRCLHVSTLAAQHSQLTTMAHVSTLATQHSSNSRWQWCNRDSLNYEVRAAL